LLSASGKTRTNRTSHLYHPAVYRMNSRPVSHKNLRAGKPHFIQRASLPPSIEKNTTVVNTAPVGLPVCKIAGLVRPRVAAFDSISELLRLKLYLDPYDYDDIVIGFNAGTTPVYNFNYDSRYLPGIGAAEGLASYSSDGMPLSINFLPLPKQTPDVIRLKVQAANSGPITLLRTELDPIPNIYSIWLVDNFAKDSVNLRTDSSYVFTINKSDTSSFGSYRFKVDVFQNPALAVHLVEFNATKANNATQVTWTTENEENYTTFAVERSSDGGETYTKLDSLTSSGIGSYSYTDKTPPAASDLYRLQITDLNGTVTYSNVVTLIYGNSANTITGNVSIYPNPTSSVINIQIMPGNASSQSSLTTESLAPESVAATGVYNISIVNTAGMTIKSASSSAATWQDNVAALSPGTYIVTVTNSLNNKVVGHTTFVKL